VSALAGKVAVVTGASRGLGRAIALALAAAGAAVALGARSRADLEETAHAVTATGARALVVPTDVTVYAEVEALVERAVAELGRVDVVVNNSGIAAIAPLAELTLEQWQGMLDVNLTGTFHGCRAAARHLLPQRSGKVINLSSVMAGVGLAGYAGYAATKGGVIAFTRALGVEWARHNVQVNAIAPGWFATDMSAPAFGGGAPKVAERLLRDIPARRIGRPEEVGPLAVYLASAASDFMTGQTIFLDGGQTAG
jgi:NAD(P)-dependent dehydrogenase (short-subunit alcohol dehydrogenase family)